MIVGLGMKVYSQGRVGFLVQLNFPITFTDAWAPVTFTDSMGVPVYSTGDTGLATGRPIGQFDIGAGVIISL